MEDKTLICDSCVNCVKTTHKRELNFNDTYTVYYCQITGRLSGNILKCNRYIKRIANTEVL